GPPPVVAALLRTVPGAGALMAAALRAAGPRTVDRGLRRAWHDPSAMPEPLRASYLSMLTDRSFAGALVEMTRAVAPLDLAPRLGEIGVPVLVVTGDDDRIVPVADSRRVAAALPAAELVVVPECGHCAHEEKPDEVVAAVESFLARTGLTG
ncbi:MAG TPA: alpha/beta hydrolase, partial [Acidimicrobiales bacterium]|nr:alpha/beta hydrolase [Acidimicrobiales bacterium]